MIYYILFCKEKHNIYEISFDILKKQNNKNLVWSIKSSRKWTNKKKIQEHNCLKKISLKIIFRKIEFHDTLFMGRKNNPRKEFFTIFISIF